MLKRLKTLFKNTHERNHENFSGLFFNNSNGSLKNALELVKDNTMAPKARLTSLWQQVRYLDHFNISGHLVECGVWKGGSSGMMALAHKYSKSIPTREIHLFDSFEGLPEPDHDRDGILAIKYSKNKAKGNLNPIGKCVGTLSENKQLLENTIDYPKSLVHYHQGWFQETVPNDKKTLGKIALLRLDGDWYESTKICIENLYELVVDGGVVVIDDYGHWEGCRKAIDEYINNSKTPIFLSPVDYSCCFWIKHIR